MESVGESKKRDWLRSMAGGSPEVRGFLGRQKILCIEIFLLVIAYISNRYESQRDQVRIEKLKVERLDVQMQLLNITSDVSSKSKPSYIERVVSENGSGLTINAEPPFELK